MLDIAKAWCLPYSRNHSRRAAQSRDRDRPEEELHESDAMTDRTRSTLRRCVATVAIGASLAIVTAQAPAAGKRAEDKRAGETFSLDVRDQRLTTFLNELLGAAGYATVISNSVEGTVNGAFQGTMDTVLREVARKNSVAFYKVGKVMFVYSNAEINARILPTKPSQADDLTQRARDRRMTDASNYLARAENGTVVAVGTPRFLELVDDLARQVELNPAKVRRPAPNAMTASKSGVQKTGSAKAAAAQAGAAGSKTTTDAERTAALKPFNLDAGTTPSGPAAPQFNDPSTLTPLVQELAPQAPAASTQSASAGRAPLRPSVVWRSAYAPPEDGKVKPAR
jgi:hypothetical protein